MPLVRISLQKGRTPAQLREIADTIHQALVDTYNVPPDDRFQIIEQREPAEIIYDAHYLGIERTDGLVFIHIVAGRWRDTETKQALYRTLAARLSANVGIRPEDVQVVLSPNDRDDWSFGNGLASYVKEA
ncbi:tautomerase family protein [Paraburkholderia edwinii]|jgi:phenylpyruvate tautomerase PptA (4-oxalocrotonate tautomerase family)|uniref:Tautomerase family protein n=1 Tax=Paraburkholderia edwinii TaxID=2861782 RepID=A0ABX8ULD0_9BURK|nr:tautomerase family protein [Paraburkholderia edwinii]QYD68090.1 tautomerase family protein [Paraburkholderia edwinii]